MSLITQISRPELAALCRAWGARIEALAATDDTRGAPLDGARLLWAIAGRESNFGQNCHPRFEPAYYTNGYYWQKSDAVKKSVASWGRDAACSYGPWQVLAINAPRFTPEQLGAIPDAAAEAAVDFLNRYVLGTRQARNLVAIADTYNSGNWRDANVPHEYIAAIVHNYFEVPLPVVAVAATAPEAKP